MIPKVADSLIREDYRPINLIGYMYKIVAKLLALRLKQVIGFVADEEKSMYVEGRNILDGPLIINEIFSCVEKPIKR